MDAANFESIVGVENFERSVTGVVNFENIVVEVENFENIGVGVENFERSVIGVVKLEKLLGLIRIMHRKIISIMVRITRESLLVRH